MRGEGITGSTIAGSQGQGGGPLRYECLMFWKWFDCGEKGLVVPFVEEKLREESSVRTGVMYPVLKFPS